MKYTRIYADSSGESHFEDVEVEIKEVNFAPPAPPVNLSSFNPASQYCFLESPAGWYGDWHPTPQRQLFFFLSGEIEIEVSDGEIRQFGPGSITFQEDTVGKGHASRVLGDNIARMVAVQLPDSEPI
ncbi:MAG: cupin domain-containing protein [Thermodesulfobacteriota bacterium]